MATSSQQLNFAVRAINEASATLKQIEGDVGRLNEKAEKGSGFFGKLGSSIGGVASVAGGFVIGSGLLALPGLLSNATNAAIEDEAASMRMDQALKNYVGTAANASSKIAALNEDIDRRITAGQRLAFTDDDIRDSLQSLLAATDDYGQATIRQAAAMDLARAKNISLEAASKLLGKINEENVDVFKRMGIELAENATEADALAAVQARFGGQAEAYAKSTAGQFESAKIRIAEIGETIGGYVLPIVARLGTLFVDEVIPRIEAGAERIGPIVTQIGDWVAENVLPRLREMGEFFVGVILPRVIEFVSMAREQLGTFIAYFESDILPALDRLTEPFQDAIAFVMEHWPEIQAFMMPIIDAVIANMKNAFTIVTSAIDLVIKLINGDFSGAWRAMGRIAEATWDMITRTIRINANIIIDIVNKLIAAWNNIDLKLPGTDFDLVPDAPTIPKLASGGIVSRPTLAWIGEGNEPEVVAPLSKLGSMGGGTVMHVAVNVNALDAAGAGEAVYRVLEQLIRDGRVVDGTII